MDRAQFNQIISKLDSTISFEQTKQLCGEFCELIEMPYYLMAIISQKTLYDPKVDILTNYPQDWMDLYLETSKQKDDPVVSYVMSKNGPVRWDQLMELDAFNSPEQKILMDEARQYGLINGLSIPIRSVSGEVAIFSVATSVGGEEGLQKLDEIIPYAHSFSSFLFESYLRLLVTREVTADIPALTNREQQCMFWACEGKTSWEISQIIGVSERTVLFHINNSTEKLGASNRQHAVAIALKNGIIKPDIVSGICS